MDILQLSSSTEMFQFTLLDTLGFVENVTMKPESNVCTSVGCKQSCHHLVWILHNVFAFKKDDGILFKKKFSKVDWKRVLHAYPEHGIRTVSINRPLTQTYSISLRKASSAKCATCKHQISIGDFQGSTEGPYKSIHRQWITRKLYFCPKLTCMEKMPRSSFLQPSRLGMNIVEEVPLTSDQRNQIWSS